MDGWRRRARTSLAPKSKPEGGPRRVRPEEIRVSFSDGWHIEKIQPAKLDVTLDPGSAHAWLASIQRT